MRDEAEGDGAKSDRAFQRLLKSRLQTPAITLGADEGGHQPRGDHRQGEDDEQFASEPAQRRSHDLTRSVHNLKSAAPPRPGEKVDDQVCGLRQALAQ